MRWRVELLRDPTFFALEKKSFPYPENVGQAVTGFLITRYSEKACGRGIGASSSTSLFTCSMIVSYILSASLMWRNEFHVNTPDSDRCHKFPEVLDVLNIIASFKSKIIFSAFSNFVATACEI